MTTIKPLTGIDADTLYAAWSLAFSDYEIKWTKEAFESMLRRRGYVDGLSFGAFDADGQLVSFTLNCIGDFEGRWSAYDTGSGTIPVFRGKGLATQVFEASIPYLKEAGVVRYLLEVLQHNTRAIAVYERVGFRISRTFKAFLQDAAQVAKTVNPLPAGYSLREIAAEEQPAMREMWDFIPSWQNSFASIGRQAEAFIAIGVFDGAQMIGYGISDPVSGDITQLAVAPAYRRQGVASSILGELLVRNGHSSVKAINVESDCSSMISLLEGAGIPLRLAAYEMIREIR